MIQCFKCKTEFQSPTDNDAFRNLFSSFGNAGVEQAEQTGAHYLAQKSGWENLGQLWACPPCLRNGVSSKVVP